MSARSNGVLRGIIGFSVRFRGVVLVLAVVRPVVTHGLPFSSSDLTSVEPEGVHGIPGERLVAQAPAWGDGGSALGSE